jgi:hypothetical protein
MHVLTYRTIFTPSSMPFTPNFHAAQAQHILGSSKNVSDISTLSMQCNAYEGLPNPLVVALQSS